MPGIKRTHEIGVEDHRLRYLSYAARHGSMRAAADILGIAPSSISRQIGQLERALCIDLVEKGSHKMRLTEAGLMLIEYHDRRAEEHHALLAKLAELRSVRSHLIRVAMSDELPMDLVVPLIKSVCERYPDTRFDLVESSSSQAQQMVLNDVVQLAVILEANSDVRLKICAVARKPIMAIVPATHPLAALAGVTMDRLASERIIMPPPHSREAELVQSVFRQNEVTLDVVLHLASTQGVLEAVTSGLGIALLPHFVESRFVRDDLVAVPVDCAELENISLHLVCRHGRRLSAAAAAFVTSLTRVMRRFEGTPGSTAA